MSGAEIMAQAFALAAAVLAVFGAVGIVVLTVRIILGES